MDRRAVSLFIEAVAASGNWQAALQALHTAGIDLQTAHCTSMDANNDNNNNNNNNNLQCLSCRDVLLLATLFKDASQWGLLRSLTLLPHHRLTTHAAHGDGHAHEGGDLVQARRLALTALFHQEEESNNNNNNNNKRHDVWELALAVARSDFMFLGSTQSSPRRREDCAPPEEKTPGPNTNNNNNTITTTSTSSSRSVSGEMLAMCLEIIQPRIPLDAQRNAALLEWSRLATASPAAPTPATDATAADAAGTEMGGCDDVQALHRLMQGPRRRETWAHALRHFMRLADSSSITGRDGYIPEEAVRAVLMCLARQAKETLVLHITDRYILGAEGHGCGTTVKHSQELFQTMAEVADLLSSKALCTKLLSYTKAATAAGIVDGGGGATGVCLLPTPSTLALVLRTLQRVGDHEAVLLWWDSWAATSNSNSNSSTTVTTTQSADIATNGNCSSWLDVTQNLNIRSHVAVSMVVRKPSAWADALRTLDEETSIAASAGRVALYKLRMLRTARQWEAALTVLREYMDHQNHNRKNSDNAREIQLLFSRQERVEQWVPRRIILQLDQEGMLTTAASSNAWMSHQKKKGGK